MTRLARPTLQGSRPPKASAPSPLPSGVPGSITIARNVAANWTGQFIAVIAGFVMPRLINDQIGQERLGVWDFGWSMVSYLGLLTAGLASSVNRYVARHRATGDSDALNRSTSACMCIFLVSGALAAAVTVLLVAALPRILPASFAPYVDEARYVLTFFGLATALSMPAMVYHGVITGCQRYDLAMYAETGAFLAAFAGILAALLLGYGLRAMAVTIVVSKILEVVLKCSIAYRVCPELRVSLADVTRRSIVEQVAFGGKTYLGQLGSICLYQGNSMLIAFFLGPASLAMYSRAMALVMHANKLLFEFGRVLIPTASGAQVSGDREALPRVVLAGARYSMLIALPVVLILTVLGTPLMRIWMGPAYASLPLLQILAIGHLAGLSQTGAFAALMGMNRHGIPAAAVMAAAVASLAFSSLCVTVFHTGLLGVAYSVATCLTLVNLLFIPVVVTRACGLSLGQYFMRSVPDAALACLPFAIWLAAARHLFSANDYGIVACGLAVGAPLLAIPYWRLVLPESVRLSLRTRVQLLVSGNASKP